MYKGQGRNQRELMTRAESEQADASQSKVCTGTPKSEERRAVCTRGWDFLRILLCEGEEKQRVCNALDHGLARLAERLGPRELPVAGPPAWLGTAI